MNFLPHGYLETKRNEASRVVAGGRGLKSGENFEKASAAEQATGNQPLRHECIYIYNIYTLTYTICDFKMYIYIHMFFCMCVYTYI